MYNATCIDILAPDLIIYNGKIITVDSDFSFAEAVAIKYGRIMAVGSNAEITALRGKCTKMLDLQKNTLMPGINDNHVHLASAMVSRPPYLLDIGPGQVQCIDDLRKVVAQAVNKAKPGEWIFAAGWNQGVIKELLENFHRLLAKSDIDDISPVNPVVLTDFSHHNAVVNSAALKAANITKDTPDPPAGKIIKDADGEPTGFLMEKANGLIEKVAPKLSLSEFKKAFYDNINIFTRYGITSVTSAGERPANVRLFSELHREAIKNDTHLPLRINLLLLWSDYELGGDLEDIETALEYVGTNTCFGDAWLKIGGIKLYGDGIPPFKTAWNSKPYDDGTYGSLVVAGNTDAERIQRLNDIADVCHANGYQLAVHTTGDRAVSETAKAMARIMKDCPKDLRHYAIHGDWVPRETIELMATWNISLSTQAELLYEIIDDTIQRLGPEAAGKQWPLKEMLDAGMLVCNSSDTPAGCPDWRIGMQAAILRESRNGVVTGIQQALNVQEAIRTYTINPAWLDHMEHLKGSVEINKLADFCILGRDITAIDPHEITSTPILMTIVGGDVVYSNSSLTIQ